MGLPLRQLHVNADPTLDFGSLESAASLESCLSVPLPAGHTLAGVLTLYAAERRAFSDGHARAVEAAAPYLATAFAAVAEPRPTPARDLKLVSSR